MRAWTLPWLVFALACPRNTVETLPSGETQVIAVRGLEVRVLPRDTSGLVHAALFVDAGSRHAQPASAATLATWSAAGTLTGTTTPDFVSFTANTDAASLPDVLRAMAAALSSRNLAPERHAELAARWEDARRRAIAQPARRADALALTGVLGVGANPLDGDVATIAQSEAFLANHFGTSRALLVIVGDIDADTAESQVREAFNRVGTASESRPSADAYEIEPISREEGTSTHATVAVEFADTRRANALGHRAHAMGLAESATIFPHAHGTVLLMRTRNLDALRSLRWMATHAFGQEHTNDETLSPAQEAQRLALQWRQDESELEGRRVALGLVCEGECEIEDPARLPQASVDGAQAEVTLPNGAQVRAIRRRSENVAWSIHLDSGGEAHGEVVVLAHALARRCDANVRLDTRGFSLSGSGPRWRRELRATLDCMTRDVANVAQDWTHVLDGLRVAPERGWIGAALSPGLSSRVAPGGRLHEVAEAQHAAQRWSWLRVGRRARVAIVGNVDPARAVHAVPVLGVWPEGSAANTAQWGDALPMSPAAWDEVARVVVGWRTEQGDPAAEIGARAFARSAAELLQRHGAVLWHEGDGGSWGAWSAVALDVNGETLDAIRAIVGQPIEVNPERETEEARWRAGDVQEVAWRAARGVPIVVTGSPSETVRALQAATPVLVVGRPQNDAALRRWQRVLSAPRQ